MDRQTFIAFNDEIEKIAYGMKDIDKVLALSKKLAIRPPAHSALGGKPFAVPMAAVNTKLNNMRWYVRNMVGEPGYLDAKKALDTTLAEVRQLGGKLFLPRGAGGTVGHLRKAAPEVKNIPLTGKQHKAVESIVRGHEMDELIAGRIGMSPTMGRYGHSSPDVILREHNRVATLPADLKPSGDFFRAMRSAEARGGERAEAGLLERATAGVSGKGIQYGESPRLSRHARKRVANLVEQQGQQEAKLREWMASMLAPAKG